MRILALTPYLAWPPEHGGRIRNFHILKSLAEKHEVLNVTGLGPHEDPQDVAGLEEVGIRVRCALLVPPVDRLSPRQRLRKYLDLARGRSSLLARFHSRELSRAIRAAVSERWDAIWIDQIWMVPYLPSGSGPPLIHASHNVESLLLRRRAETVISPARRFVTRLEARRLARAEKRLLERAALTVATSADDGEAFRELAPDANIAVVANGVDLAARPLLPSPRFDPLRLMFLGGYDYPPNLDAAQRLVHEVLPLLKKIEPSTEIHLVGRDPALALTGLGAQPDVRIHGHVKNLLEIYENMSALVVPMAFGGGSRLKILEAWALGRPVVATASGASGLEAQHGQHFLQADTPAELAATILSLRSRPETVRTLIANGRARVEADHDWPVLGQRFLEFMHEALGRADHRVG